MCIKLGTQPDSLFDWSQRNHFHIINWSMHSCMTTNTEVQLNCTVLLWNGQLIQKHSRIGTNDEISLSYSTQGSSSLDKDMDNLGYVVVTSRHPPEFVLYSLASQEEELKHRNTVGWKEKAFKSQSILVNPWGTNQWFTIMLSQRKQRWNPLTLT